MRIGIQKIFEEIEECAGGNKKVTDFLKKLLLMEIEKQQSKWQYTEIYKKMLQESTKGGSNI